MSAKQSSVLLYYHLLSQPSRAIKIFLDANKVQFIPKEMNLAEGEHLQPEFSSINPFQKVPVISHNGFVLTESVAIVRYLSREFDMADHWYPKDSARQARVDEFLEWQHLELRAPCAMFFQYKFLRPLLSGKESNRTMVERVYRSMVKGCDSVENVWLKDRQYLSGNNISVADIFGACELEQPRVAGYNPVDGRPKMAEWLARVKRDLDPYYAEAHKLLEGLVRKHGGKAPASISKL